MRNLRFCLRDAALAVMAVAFSIPAFAQQQGPIQPIERQQPAPSPNAPAPPAPTAATACSWDAVNSRCFRGDRSC